MNSFYNLLGLANRARKCITGEETIISSVRNNKVKLVIVAGDASDNTKKLYQNKCQFYQVKCIEYGQIENLSQALGKVNRVAVGISDQGFAKSLLAKLTEKE